MPSQGTLWSADNYLEPYAEMVRRYSFGCFQAWYLKEHGITIVLNPPFLAGIDDLGTPDWRQMRMVFRTVTEKIHALEYLVAYILHEETKPDNWDWRAGRRYTEAWLRDQFEALLEETMAELIRLYDSESQEGCTYTERCPHNWRKLRDEEEA